MLPEIEGHNQNLINTLQASSEIHTLLPGIINFKEILGGLVHDVYRIETKTGNFFLKHRGENFAHLKKIKINPKDLVYEHKALSVFSQLAPDNFPELVTYNQEQNYLIMTDVSNGDDNLEEQFRKNQVTDETIKTLGLNLRYVLDQAATAKTPIHESGDHNSYISNLHYRLGYQNNPYLNTLIKELNLEPRQLILGDLSPKNIIIKDSGNVKFYDLEGAHQGNYIFEVGFLLGHLILHSHEDVNKALKCTEIFKNEFNLSGKQLNLLKSIVIGTIMYRLKGVIPYPINLIAAQKEKILENCVDILPQIMTNDIGWEEIIPTILKDVGFYLPKNFDKKKNNEQIIYQKNKDNPELSINLTNKCTNACVFCIRDKHLGWDIEQDNDNLVLQYEPSIDEIVSEAEKSIEESKKLGVDVKLIKYCGFGDPLLKPDIIIEATKKIKMNYPDIQFQIDTNGWTYFLHKDSTILQSLYNSGINKISISLNASNSEDYQKINRPNNIYAKSDAFAQTLRFIELVAMQGFQVRITAVEIPGIDLSGLKKIAEDVAAEYYPRKYIR